MIRPRHLAMALDMVLPHARASHHRPQSEPNYRGDGHDDARIARAAAKRERRSERNIRNAYRVLVHR